MTRNKQKKKHNLSQRKQRLDKVLVKNFALVFCSTQNKVHVYDFTAKKFVAISNRAWELLSTKAWFWRINIAVFAQESNKKLRVNSSEIVPDKAVLHSELSDFITQEHIALYQEEQAKGNNPFGIAFFASPAGSELDDDLILSLYEKLKWDQVDTHLEVNILK